ncbi:MAG: hypothetical protein WD960_02120 [Gemmatimonadota bacterium]
MMDAPSFGLESSGHTGAAPFRQRASARRTSAGGLATALRFVGIACAGLAALLAPGALAAQDALPPEHEAIAFLIGEWRTTSEFPDGRTAEGNLRYRWVFEGAWMQVEFFGERDWGGIWEAHVMQRWDPESESYQAWVFPADGPPLRYLGSVPEPGMFRVQYSSAPGVTSGIDYHRQDDGTVYQENWAVEGGERRVTLRTRYRPAGS